jgi:hypothetical protein
VLRVVERQIGEAHSVHVPVMGLVVSQQFRPAPSSGAVAAGPGSSTAVDASHVNAIRIAAVDHGLRHHPQVNYDFFDVASCATASSELASWWTFPLSLLTRKHHRCTSWPRKQRSPLLLSYRVSESWRARSSWARSGRGATAFSMPPSCPARFSTKDRDTLLRGLQRHWTWILIWC